MMRRSQIWLGSVALPLLLGLAAPAIAETIGKPIVVAQAEDRVAAARAALDKAQATLKDAEETGGDIRAARRAVANAMKSLRAAETAAGKATAAKEPAAKEPAADAKQADVKPATPRNVAPLVPAIPSGDAGPKPYQPPAAAKPAVTAAKPEPAKPQGLTTIAPRHASPAPAPSASAAAKPSAPRQAAPEAAAPVARAPRPDTQRAQAQRVAPAPAPLAMVSPTGRPPRAANPTVVRRGNQLEVTYRRADGSRIVDITDRRNRLVRRIAIAPNGNETVLFDRDRPIAPRVYQRPLYSDPWRVPPPPGYGDWPNGRIN